ncbi:MAG: hypothetical protein IJ646_10025 [Clostridia bacterium]|nr:hypothetical protein [Clostridia bacterium]
MTLDLNGYTVDRNLTKKASDGSVIYVTGGKLTVTDTSRDKAGRITGGYSESGGGIRVYGGDLVLEAGHITGNQVSTSGGGVHIARGTFTMNGGSIEGNRADSKGGGVNVYAYAYDSAFIQNGGSVTDNTAKHGGGVYEFQNPFESKYRGSYTLNGGSVSGNHATSNGGGVYVEGAAFTLNGGGIVNNAAQYGGGLYVMAKDEAVALKGGSITGNTADQKGSGVYHSSGILRLAGGPVTVADNTGDDLYIFNELNTALAVEGTLNGASNIRVSVEHAPSEDTPKVIGTADTDCSACFTSADESYVVTWRNGQVLLATPEAAKSPWTRLQEALNAGGTVKLTEDVTAEAGETILIVGAGAKVTLDLNGHTIDRGLKEPVEDGGVLRVTGGATLTVTDSSAAQTGRITGGNTTGSGGGIHIRGGAVTMSSASVTGNAAKVNGGGVYVENGLFYASDVRVTGNTAQGCGGGVYLGNGTLMLYSDQMEMEDETLILPGAAITGNEAAQGGGVYMAGGAFNVSGIPTVKDNAGGNIYLPKGKALTVDRALEAGAALAVTMAEPGAFTSGLKNYRTRYEQKGIDPAAFFASDDATLAVGLNADNEATLHRHVPGETPEWTWTEDYTAATAAMKCAECGEAFWTETATVTGPAYDEAQKKFVLTATAAHADKTYTDTRAFEAVHNEEKAPEIDETGTYHSGIIECYSVTMGTRTLYFAAQDGKPGEPLEDGAWKLDWFEFDAEAQAIVRYTGGYGEGTTAVELPSHIVDPENEEKKIELTQLGGGDQRFLDMQAAAGGAVTVTDRGSIAYIAPGAFDSHKNVTLALTGDQAITVAEDAFDTAEDVTLRVNHASGLTAGDCDDVTGVYTVELADAHTYKAEAVFADDYATAQIVLTCACGETHTFDAKEITRTEDMTTHRFAFTATGEYEGAAYTAEIKDVESFKVTVNANDGQGDQECYVPKAQGKAYAMFAASAEWLAGLVPPLAADIDELSADGMRYPGGQTVKIEKDTEFTAKWKSIWAKVDAALGEGKSVKLYSDIAPAEGDVYLHVPAGVSAALDMDGHTVDRRLTQAIARGYVILVDGTLTLKNGTVTGGDNTGNGGGVFVNSAGRLEATGGVHVYKNLSGQNGGGVYIAEGGAISVDGGSITYNQAQAKGGALYIGGDAEVAIDDQETPENAMKPLNAGPVPASAYMRSCQIARNIAENGGGFYVDHGQISMDSGFECINNTDQSGKYNNIDVDPKQSDPFKLPENPVADLIKLGVPGSLAGGAGGTSWLSWLFGAIAGTAAIGGGIAVMLYDDHKEKDSEGEEYSDQGKDCKHPRWSTRTFWEESHYSNVQEFRTCTVCGLMVKNTLTPTNKVIDGDVTEYTVTRTDGQQEKRQVPPYTAILDASMPGGAELPSGFEGTQIKTIPHKKGEGGRLALPETIWFEVDGLIFEGWLVGDSIVTGVDFPADTQEKTRVRIRWKLPVKYEAGVTAAEDPSLKGADPQSPNPSWVTPGSTHVVRENTWSRDDYDFNGWEVSSGFSLVWDGKKLSLEYSFGDAEGVGAGTPLVILVPTVLRAKWISKWKKLDNELNAAREGSEVSMKENVTGTRDDVTMILTSDSTLDMRGFTLDANGGKPNAVLNVFDVSNKITVRGAGTIKNGKNLKGGAVVVLPKGTFKLEDATITDNVAEAIDGQADGGAVYVSGEATFEMTGGTLKNNRAANHGGAVVVAKDGSFKMTGGEISGNKVTADKDAQGGGVYVEGSFKVSGKVVVKDNTAPKAGEEDEEKKDKPSNVYLTKGAVIEVVDKLDEKAELHVTMAEPGVITKGLNAKDEDETKRRGVAENFVSDDEDYRVVINDDGEAELTRKFKITVKDGIEHGKVEPSQETAWADEVITLTVKPDDGYNMKEDSLKGTYKVKEDGQEVEKTVELEMMTDSEEQKYRFTMPAADVEVSVEFEQIKPAFKSHSLLLNGEIGVNFFMELPALEGVDYEKSYMEFTVKSKDGPKTVARYDAEFKDTRGRGYYGFTCNVNAIQMAAPIEAVFHYGDDQTVSQTYSVKHYVTAYEKVKDQYDASITALVHALADYGHYAQPALSEANGWKIGTDYAEMDVYYTKYLDLQTAAKAVARYRMKLDFGSSKVEKVNYTLNLLSQTELRVLIALKDGYKGDVSFKLDGQPVEAELQPDGRYRVTISNIPAQKLDDTHTVSAITTTGTATCTLAPLTYVDWFIQTGNIRINREAMAALYYYYKAAMDYWDVNG